MRDGIGKASASDIDEEHGRTGIDDSSGAVNTGQDTCESAADSTTSRKQINSIERLSAGTKDSLHRQAHMTTALAAAVS
jgi:hypothetical protein